MGYLLPQNSLGALGESRSPRLQPEFLMWRVWGGVWESELSDLPTGTSPAGKSLGCREAPGFRLGPPRWGS